MNLDFIVVTGALFHNGDGSVSFELARLRSQKATDSEIAERFAQLYPECRELLDADKGKGGLAKNLFGRLSAVKREGE